MITLSENPHDDLARFVDKNLSTIRSLCGKSISRNQIKFGIDADELLSITMSYVFSRKTSSLRVYLNESGEVDASKAKAYFGCVSNSLVKNWVRDRRTLTRSSSSDGERAEVDTILSQRNQLHSIEVQEVIDKIAPSGLIRRVLLAMIDADGDTREVSSELGISTTVVQKMMKDLARTYCEVTGSNREIHSEYDERITIADLIGMIMLKDEESASIINSVAPSGLKRRTLIELSRHSGNVSTVAKIVGLSVKTIDLLINAMIEEVNS